jgi:hypothetical protein
MAVNLLDLFSRAVTPDAVQGISKLLGEDPSAVKGGVATLVPVLLGGLASKASTPSGAASLFSMINSPDVDTGIMGKIGNVLGSGGSGALSQQGGNLIASLFGADKTSGIASALSGITGMKGGSATSLLLMAVPMLFSVLKRFVGENGLNATGLASLLAGQKEFLSGKLDPRLTPALGLGSHARLLSDLGETAMGTVRGAATAAAGAGAAAASTAAAGASGLARWWPWLLGAVVVALLLTMLPRCGTTVNREAAPVATTQAPATAPASATTTAVVSLPAKVYFETGKAELNAEGSAVVKAVAAILGANGSTKVDLTGFTDKTGDTAANEELAKKRAQSVAAALQAQGVSSDRVNMKPPTFVEVGAGGSDAEARRVEIASSK